MPQPAESGGNAGSSGAGAAGSAGTAGLPIDPQPTCPSPAVACNGACLDPGASAGGCTYLTQVQPLDGLAASDGDAFASLGFPFVIGGETPPTGLYRIDGQSLELLPLDTTMASGATLVVVASGTSYYMKPGTFTDGFIRSVSTSGGDPNEILTDIQDGRGLWVRGDRLYFAAALDAAAQTDVYWLPLDGAGDPEPTALVNISRGRMNRDALVTSFNGNIDTAPLPDLTPRTRVMGDFALPDGRWWIDDDYVYWVEDGSYERSLLTAVGATAEDGELVTTLPPELSIDADAGPELLLSASQATAVGIFTMPVSGGSPEHVGTLGSMGAKPVTADASYVYVDTGRALIRLDR